MYLYQRKNSPYWWVEYYIDGNRIRRSTETASRRDASRIAKQFQEDDREHARKTKVNQKSNSITLDGRAAAIGSNTPAILEPRATNNDT